MVVDWFRLEEMQNISILETEMIGLVMIGWIRREEG